MIEYIKSDSSFYERNVLFCQKVEENLLSMDFKVAGFCSSYGYDLTFLNKEKDEKVNYLKSTYKSVFRGRIYLELSYEKKLFSDYPWMIAGTSVFFSLFTFRKYKNQLPKNAYFFSRSPIDYAVLNLLSDFITKYKGTKFSLKKGKIRIIINQEIDNPKDIIDRLRKIFM